MFIEKFTDEQIMEIHLINEQQLVNDLVYSDGIIGFIEIRTSWKGSLTPKECIHWNGKECIHWNGRVFGGLRELSSSGSIRYGIEVGKRFCLVRWQPSLINLDSDIYFDWYTESIIEDKK